MTAHPLPPGISIIVCCHNASAVIEPTIRALGAQARSPGVGYEAILVDNNCSDDTVPRARRAWTRADAPLNVVREPTPGLIHARRAGVRAATYDRLLFVDDDNILEPDWLEGLVRIFDSQPTVGIVGGYSEPMLPAGCCPPWFLRYQIVYACGPQAPRPGLMPRNRKRHLYGAGLAFRTEVARAVVDGPVPMFLVGRTGRRLLRGDDTEMCFRAVLLGWDLWYEPTLRLRHNLPASRLTWDNVCQMRAGTGASFPILHLYTQLTEGRPLWGRKTLIKHSVRAWAEFWARPQNARHLSTVGHPSAFQFAFLRGLTRGTQQLAGVYPEIRAQLESAFGSLPAHSPGTRNLAAWKGGTPC